MFREVLVPLIGLDGDEHAVDVAIALAGKLDARLVVLAIVELPVPMSAPWGVMQEIGLVDVYETLRKLGQQTVATMRARLARESIRSDVRLLETLTTEPEHMAALAAHYADLVVVAGRSGGSSEASVAHRYIGGLLMGSGVPVLMLPKDAEASRLPPRRVVLGWKPTRESTRAMHDAMPFLRSAEKVELVIVNPQGGEQGHGQQPGNDIATHLLQHGVKVDVVVTPASEDSTAMVLMKRAAAIDADLVVVGGYGHSRLREWTFGGVTRELLEACTRMVLFSH